MKIRKLANKTILPVVLISTLLSGCFFGGGGENDAEKDYRHKDSSFILVEHGEFWNIVRHRETNVLYAISTGYCNEGAFTVLVDENGRLMLWGDDYER